MAYWLSQLLPLALLPLGLSKILLVAVVVVVLVLVLVLVLGLIGRRRWPVVTAVLTLWFFHWGW